MIFEVVQITIICTYLFFHYEFTLNTEVSPKNIRIIIISSAIVLIRIIVVIKYLDIKTFTKIECFRFL